VSIAVLAPVGNARPADGGTPARRAVVRWAWRLFRREWRQQFLIFALITVAVVAAVVGSAVATNTPPAKSSGFGTAQDSVTFTSLDTHAKEVIANLEHRFVRVELIENDTESIPGSINTYQLRAQDPHGPFSGPMLSLVSGHYPSGANEVAVTSGIASAFHLSVGDSWRVGAVTRQVVGIVENPQSLLDEFALLAPGQLRHPEQVTALFDAPGVPLSSIGNNVETPATIAQSNPLNPETISLAALVLGMLLIALVSVGGFTVLAQRRLRSIGMLEATGATDRHVRLVVRANGAVVGLVGAVAGFVLSLVIWLAYRPSLEQSAHHVIGVLALPWIVVAAAMVLAVVAAYFAASRPARAVTKIPTVTALSGRPAPPRQIHRSALPGIVLLVVAFLLLGYSGAESSAAAGTQQGNGSVGAPELVLGIVLLIPGLLLLAPFFLSLTSYLGRRAPIAIRLALRDLARYRSRSGSALAAISIGVLVAVIIMLAAAARYGNVLDYAGPNLAANELALHASFVRQGQSVLRRTATGYSLVANPPKIASPAQLAASSEQIARRLSAQLLALETPTASLAGAELGRTWSGAIYVATPQLLRAFGMKASQIDPNADILSSRPDPSGVSGLDLNYAQSLKAPGASEEAPQICTAATSCLAHPVIQEVGTLPTGTSGPNTVITERTMRELHIQASTSDWLIQGTQPFTATQISNAELAASTTQLSVESKDDQPTSSAVISWATIFGIVIALGVLGMSVGLVRSETAGDLRTLAATGASGFTRRTLTAVTAGALGFLGAALGTLGGYIAMIGWLRSNSLNGGIAALGNIPVADLLFILVGMPVFAAVVGWLFAGREPATMTHQAIE
jgi:putative ABC transport system permease protein